MGTYMLGLSVDDLTDIFYGHLNWDSIPLILITFSDGQPIETASSISMIWTPNPTCLCGWR